MWQDWALQKTNDEIRIMHQHAKITKLVTLYYARKKNIKLFYYQNKFLLVNSRLCLYI